ncbi:hypothetical protein ACVIGB_000382 [Bradyrhizobium sp. USDA 4341]
MTNTANSAPLSERIAILRAGDPWRYPTSLSALAWIFCGSGQALSWQSGRLVDDGVGDPDQPYLAPDAIEALGAGRAPLPLSNRLAEFLPTPGMIVPSLHTRDFCPPGSLPAARIPFEADHEHLAGSIIVCRFMLSCAALLIEPAGVPRGRIRTLLRSSLNAACLIASERTCEDAVAAEAERLLQSSNTAAAGAPSEFVDPMLSGDGR